MTLREFLEANKCTAAERRELLRYFLFIRWMELMELAK